MNNATKFAQENFETFVEQLKSLVRVPSISFPGFPEDELQKSAQVVADLMKKSQLENVEMLDIDGAAPYVYGDWLNAPGKPTLLLYAHYDVQPVGDEKLWKTPPFEPTQGGDRLFGRGTADDKAGIILHLAAVASCLKTDGKLPINVKVLIEGEEECGSDHLEPFLEKYVEKLKADAVIVADLQNFDTGIPAISTSLRGLVALEVEVKVMKQSLHSGSWGGPGPDPVIALSKMIASLVDKDGMILVPGIYDDVRPLNDVEQKSIDSLPYTDDDYRSQTGLIPSAELVGGKASALVKMWRQPSISVNAIQASSRENKANIINASAWCKVGIRTVPGMDIEKTRKQLEDHLKAQAPWGAEVTFSGHQDGPWWITDPAQPILQKAQAALAKAFEKDCVFLGVGGSIPFIGSLTEALGGVPAILVGVEDPYTQAHSENESVHLGDMKKSIVGEIYLFETLFE